MQKFIFVEPEPHKLACSIADAIGIEANSIRRLVIDFEVGSAGKLYLETFADEAILDVDITALGVDVKPSPGSGVTREERRLDVLGRPF